MERIDLTKATRIKLKKVVQLLAQEKDFISNQDFLKNYANELAQVGITTEKQSSGSLSSSIIKTLMKEDKSNSKYRLYLLVDNWKDLVILEKESN